MGAAVDTVPSNDKRALCLSAVGFPVEEDAAEAAVTEDTGVPGAEGTLVCADRAVKGFVLLCEVGRDCDGCGLIL